MLQNINKLNRSLEGVIAVCAPRPPPPRSLPVVFLGLDPVGYPSAWRAMANGVGGWQVGNEFGAVEALWSQFENVMAKGEGDEGGEEGEEGEQDAGRAEERRR